MSAEKPMSQAEMATQEKYSGVLGYLRILWHFIDIPLRYWDKLLLRVVYQFINNSLYLLAALVTAKIVDEGLIPLDWGAFLKWTTIVIAIHLHSILFLIIYSNVANYVYLMVNLTFKERMFRHVQRMSLAFHQMRPIGENMYRINNDTEMATDFVGSSIPEFIERVILVFANVGILMVLNPIIGVLLTIYIPVYYLFSNYIVGFTYQSNQRVRRREQRTQAILQESLSAFPISKALSRERHERRRYWGRLADLMRARLSFHVLDCLWMQGSELMREAVVTQLGYVMICGHFVILGKLTIGEFVALAVIINLVEMPLRLIVVTLQRMRIASVPAQRMMETLELEPAIHDKPDAVVLESPRGEVRFENVSFRYSPDGPDVIKNLSFAVEPGRKVAIVGVSGAGKTSIFNLLMRFSDPTGGRVLIDGIDLRDLKLESYMSDVSVVLQENFLFSASIRDNILMGNIHADEERLNDAIARAGLWPTIHALPEGLDTVLLEGGNLSMGQKQRVAIARAVIRDPRFLYLDEATSSLDPATEIQILEQLAEIEAGRTRLVIAHHISTVKNADGIIVMENGELVQQGTHEALAADPDGAYRRLWSAERARHEGAS